MTRRLQDYIAQSEQWVSGPAVGDDFAINIREECLLESHIIESSDDSIVIQGDDRLLELLEQYHMLGETDENTVTEKIQRYGAVGSNRAMGFTLEDSTDKDQDSANEHEEIDEDRDLQRIQKLAGLAEDQDDLAGKAAALAAVGADTAPQRVTTVDEGVMSSIDMDLRHIARTQRRDALVDALRGDQFGRATSEYLHDMLDDIEAELDRRGQRNVDMNTKLSMLMDRIQEIYAGAELAEAEYQGRKVPLGKPMRGDVKKKKVYVRKPNGNVVKVEFGDPNMRIRKSNPARRKSFRARHNCDNPGPRWKARYWSCRAW